MVLEPFEFYSKNAEKHGKKHSIDRIPEELLLNLRKFVEMVGDGKVLVPGSGSGRDVEFFCRRGFEAAGVDFAKDMVEYARENRECGRYVKEDMRRTSFGQRSFDGVWACACIYFLPPGDMNVALKEFYRVLKEEGLIYIDFKLGDGRILKEEFGDRVYEHHLSVNRAEELLEEAGFLIKDRSTNTSQSGNNTFVNFFCKKF